MSSAKSGGKNDIKYEVVSRGETERSGMDLSMDMLMKVRGKRYWIFIAFATVLISVLHFYLFKGIYSNRHRTSR